MLESYTREHESLAHEIGADAAPRAAGGMGRRHPVLRAGREGHRDPEGVQPGRERRRRPDPMAARRLGRPHRVDRRSGSRTWRAPRPSSRNRARAASSISASASTAPPTLSNGLSLTQAAPALVDVPDLLRLRQARHPALRADGAAGDPPLHPRFDRPRRGRPDPPARRAPRRPAGDSRSRRDPAGRRERGLGGVAGGARSHPPAGRTRADAAGRADHRSLPLRVRGGAAARGLRARRSRTRATRR